MQVPLINGLVIALEQPGRRPAFPTSGRHPSTHDRASSTGLLRTEHRLLTFEGFPFPEGQCSDLVGFTVEANRFDRDGSLLTEQVLAPDWAHGATCAKRQTRAQGSARLP